MEKNFIGLDQDLMVDRLISNVRVKRSRGVLPTYTYKGYHGISTDISARKWVIGLDKSKWTLQYKTKDNVR